MQAIVRLPVAGLDVALRPPVGAEDVMLVEVGSLDMRLALALLGRVARRVDGAALDVAALPITDIDVLLLRLRQRLIGDMILAEGSCPAPDCRTRVDVSFSIAAYLEHNLPMIPPGVAPAGAPGWYGIAGVGVEFRIPQAADDLAIARAAEPARALWELCVRAASGGDGAAGGEGGEGGEEARARVEAAMEAMAPSLYSELEGTCPECGMTVEASFEPLRYVLRELRDQAAFIYEDVCAIAHWYHWSEAEILALPSGRRARYAELAEERRARQAPWERSRA